MARVASTYRGARRNACIREMHAVWNPEWYYSRHDNSGAYPKGFKGDTRAAVYIPAKRTERKRATTSGGVHELLKRGDYAGAIRKFFSPKTDRTRASGRGD